jgi:hypothetical protein
VSDDVVLRVYLQGIPQRVAQVIRLPEPDRTADRLMRAPVGRLGHPVARFQSSRLMTFQPSSVSSGH